jgi:hypothetical protein
MASGATGNRAIGGPASAIGEPATTGLRPSSALLLRMPVTSTMQQIAATAAKT